MSTTSGQLRLEDLDRITNIVQASSWLNSLGIKVTDRNLNLEKAKGILRGHLEQGGGTGGRQAASWADQDTTTAAMKEDGAHRGRLGAMYRRTTTYVGELPTPFKNDLGQMFPNFQQQLDVMTEELGGSQCVLLVAGEMGAGKSSLVNLLLGRDLLPTSDLQCTAAVVEIAYGAQPKAVIQWKDDSSGRSNAVITRQCDSNYNEEKFLQDLEADIVKRDPYTDESPYEKIKLFWPVEMLKGGVVIVDTPGVGDSRSLPHQLAGYMESACGFIYVIDSTCAIHKHRLGQLLLKAVETQEFDPSTAMFICNRWDHVRPEDNDRVKKALHERLEMILPEVKMRQLYPISAQKCRTQVDYGQVLPEHQSLVKSIRRFLPEAMRGKLRRYYRYLSTILKRSLYTLRMSYNMNRRKVEDIRQHTRDVEQRLERLQGDAKKMLEDMRTDVKRSTYEAGRDIMSHLDSMRTRMRLLAWMEDDCPRKEKSWQSLLKSATLVIADKVASEINEWEGDNDRVGLLQKDILGQFQKKFEVMDKQLGDIGRILMIDEVGSSDNAFPQSIRDSMVNKKAAKMTKPSKGGPAFLSMGIAVTSGVTLDPKNSELKTLFKDTFTSQPSRAMAKATEIFVGELNEVVVVSALARFFDRFAKGLDKVAEFFPELINADRELLRQLNTDLQSGEKKLDVFPTMSKTVADLQGELDMFFVQRLMVPDFTYDQLVYSQSDRLGKGTFANVYKGQLKLRSAAGDNQSLYIAIKEPIHNITIGDVSDVLLEETMLREIEHKNVVRYYGVCRKGPDNDLRLIMLMEHCPYTLKERCIDTSRAPSTLGGDPSQQNQAISEVCNFLYQICSGLHYLHNKKIVHRDLKPDNVLLTENSEVRIADLGLAKKVKDIATLGIGTPVYMAPEILLLLDKYDTQADIYSLAMIMWELWYGRDLAEYAAVEITGGLKTNIRSGWRPSCTARHAPPEFWKSLMMSCWEENPTRRPTAGKVGRALMGKLRELDGDSQSVRM